MRFLTIGEVGVSLYLRGPGITDPTLDPEPALLTAINGAKVSITALIFSVSLPDVRDALIAAYKRGVTVRMVCDATQAKSVSSAVPALAAAGIDVRLWGAAYQEAHDKVAIIDQATVLTGSYNWTQLAEHSNIENMVVLKGKRITSVAVPAYLTQWQNAYAKGKAA